MPFKPICNDAREELPNPEELISFASLCVPINSQFEQATQLSKRFRLRQNRVLYIDDDIIVVNKPTGIQTAPGFNSNDSLATVIQNKVHSASILIMFHSLTFFFS